MKQVLLFIYWFIDFRLPHHIFYQNCISWLLFRLMRISLESLTIDQK